MKIHNLVNHFQNSTMLCEACKTLLETPLAEFQLPWVCVHVRACVRACVCENGHQGKDIAVIDMNPWIFKSASLCWKVSRFVSCVTEWQGKWWGYYYSKNLILTTVSQRWHRNDYGYRFRNNEIKDLEESAGIRSLGSSCSWKQMTRLLGKLENLLN